MTEMSGPQIALAYNEIAQRLGRPTVKKFRTVADGLRRLKEIQEQAPVNSRNRTKIDPRLIITPLSNEAPGRGETRKRYAELLRVGPMSVENYTSSIGSVGDLKWWRNRGAIKIG